jgi:UrcA family protein
VLLQRITRAARQVCEIDDIRDLTALAQSQACERRAVTEAVDAVHSERLAALYARAQTRS